MSGYSWLDFRVTEAVQIVIVDHADGLHERVTDRRADELETALREILTQRIGDRRARGDRLSALSPQRLAVDKAPHVVVETSELALHFAESLRVGDRGIDLQSIANDAGVVHQCGDFPFVVPGDLRGIETVKRAAIVVALVQDRLPTETSLRAFENQKPKQARVVVKRHAPFFVVVSDRQWRPGPGATLRHRATDYTVSMLCPKVLF